MWVRFTAAFDFLPPEMKGRVMIAYKADQVANVTRGCAAKAVAAGKAVKIPAPSRPDHD